MDEDLYERLRDKLFGNAERQLEEIGKPYDLRHCTWIFAVYIDRALDMDLSQPGLHEVITVLSTEYGKMIDRIQAIAVQN
jgi:hypothetical protein